MKTEILPDKPAMAHAAATRGAELIRRAISTRGSAVIVVPTGASQIEMLDVLIAAPDISWQKVDIFHLDEYVGLPITHPASFRKFLWDRFHRRLPLPPRSFCYLDGEADPKEECRRASQLIAGCEIDVAFVGIGENGHLAFNDPPADFTTGEPYIVVELDEGCRRQQAGEGWFATPADVPSRAISMSIRQIMKCSNLIVTVPDERKSDAVGRALGGSVTPEVPASILQEHSSCHIFLEPASASCLP